MSNYCRLIGPAHVCDTADSITGQNNCEFSEKARDTSSTRWCMYLVFDEFCQCQKAYEEKR